MLAGGFGIAFALLLPGAASTAFWVVAGLCLLRMPRRHAPLEPEERGWLCALLLVPVVAALSLLNSSDPAHGAGRIEKFLRFAMAAPIFLAWRASVGATGVRTWFLFLGFGALAAGAVAFMQVAFGGWERAAGAVHPIFFGDGAIVLAVVAAVLGSTPGAPRRLLLAGAAGGMLAAILSGTRNALLVVPFALPLLPVVWRRSLSGQQFARVVLGSLAVLVAGLVVMPGLPASFLAGGDEILTWARGDSSGDASSLGGRLALWELCMAAWREHPWLGGGIGDYLPDLDGLARAGGNAIFEVNPNLRDHAHSIYLQALVGQGILGILVLGAVLLFPLGRGLVLLRKASDSVELARALACLSPALCFLVFGIGESWTVKNSFISLYLLLQAPLLALASRPPAPDPGSEQPPSAG